MVPTYFFTPAQDENIAVLRTSGSLHLCNNVMCAIIIMSPCLCHIARSYTENLALRIPDGHEKKCGPHIVPGKTQYLLVVVIPYHMNRKEPTWYAITSYYLVKNIDNTFRLLFDCEMSSREQNHKIKYMLIEAVEVDELIRILYTLIQDSRLKMIHY